MKTYVLPKTFVMDSLARDLDIGVIQTQNKTRVTLAATDTQIAELLSDAEYYATEARYMGSDYRALGRSALATVNAIRRQVQ